MGTATNLGTGLIIARDPQGGEVRLVPGVVTPCTLDTGKHSVTKRLIESGAIRYSETGETEADAEAAAKADAADKKAKASRAKDDAAKAKADDEAAAKAAEEAAQKAAAEAEAAAKEAGED